MPGLGHKEEVEDAGDNLAENCDEGDGEGKASGRITDAEVLELSAKLASHWKKLAPKLGLPDEKLAEIGDNKENSDEEKCLALLSAWVEIEGLEATQDEIVYILEGLKLANIIE